MRPAQSSRCNNQLICVLAVACATVFLRTANASDFPLSGIYTAKGAQEKLRMHPEFAVRHGDKLVISKKHLARMWFSKDGLAEAKIEDSWYYVKPDGTHLKVIFHDNGPDEFSEGLTRSLVGGKIAYFDKRFRDVIGPKYDWGWQFEGGRALVAVGCAFSQPDSEGHVLVSGGRWGYIDHQGKQIVPVVFSKDEAISRGKTLK